MKYIIYDPLYDDFINQITGHTQDRLNYTFTHNINDAIRFSLIVARYTKKSYRDTIIKPYENTITSKI